MTLIAKKKKELNELVSNVELGKLLGQGGNGVVYAGQHETAGAVAVKFMLNDNMKRFSRFKDEVRVVTERLNDSSRVLPIFESSLTEPSDRIPYYVMPSAVTLKSKLEGASWSEKLTAMAELAEGLAEIHDVEVAHRDIKPENIFFFDRAYRFGDFGIASFPEKLGVTEKNEPMGPWAFMANEMLTNPMTADPYMADIYSFAKTVWAVLTEEKVPFSGQYSTVGTEALTNYSAAGKMVVEPLEALLSLSTSSTPASRPTAKEFASALRQSISIQSNFKLSNTIQWAAAEIDALLGNAPSRAEWTTVDSIAKALSILSRREGLNHFFYPEGGGQQIKSVSVCEQGTMLSLGIPYQPQYIVAPKRLTLERFVGHPELGYAVLEVRDVEKLGAKRDVDTGDSELLLKIGDCDYTVQRDANYDDHDAESSSQIDVEACERRYRKGIFVIAPTAGIYNAIDDYMGTAQQSGRNGIRKFFNGLASKDESPKQSDVVRLIPKVRLRSNAEPRANFELKHLDLALLTSMIRLDDEMQAEVRKSNKLGTEALIDSILAPPTEAAARRNQYQKTLTEPQRSELFALIQIGRNIVSPLEMTSNVEANIEARHEPGYVMEKMGCGYLRKALSRFGLDAQLPESKD